MNQREQDLQMLADLLDKDLDALADREVEAFVNMRGDLQAYAKQDIAEHGGFRQLTEKQRAWVSAVHQRVIPQYENLVSSGLVPRGKEVPLMVGALPKKPPPMPQKVVPQRARAEHRPFRPEGLDEKEGDE
jgi:hypothetical protein